MSDKTAQQLGPLGAKRAQVFIIGDSYIRRGGERVRETVGTNMGLDAQVQWFGRGGLVWRNLLPFFHRCLGGRAVPDVLVIHCGGNDLGRTKGLRLIKMIKQDLQDLHWQFPGMKIIFSSITQRCQWRYGHPKKMDKARRFVNSVMAAFVPSIDGAIVHHHQIRFRDPDHFVHDGVHLTRLGNDIFLRSIALCLKYQIQ